MSNSVYRDSNVVTTLLAIRNQMSANLGIGFQIDRTTTINTKRGVYPNQEFSQFPKIRYFGIGIKGYANLTSENNIAQPYMPQATDCDLYEPIPFRCVTTPLTGDTADMYRMRTTATINGIKYYQYWLKKITFQTNVPKTTKIENNIESTYTIDTQNLNPTPSDLNPTDIEDTETRIICSVTGVCTITGEEVTEVINAMYGGDMRRARISEIGTYSGVEMAVGDETGTGGFPAGTESIYTQLCSHKCMIGQTLADANAVMIDDTVFENNSCVSI